MSALGRQPQRLPNDFRMKLHVVCQIFYGRTAAACEIGEPGVGANGGEQQRLIEFAVARRRRRVRAAEFRQVPWYLDGVWRRAI